MEADIRIAALYHYPVKSMKGMPQGDLLLDTHGVAGDRLWMLVDPKGNFLTQREIPGLALFQALFVSGGLEIRYGADSIFIPEPPTGESGGRIEVQIFDKTVLSACAESPVHAWLSRQLGRPVFLVRRIHEFPRKVNSHPDANLNFQDGHQLLLISEPTLDLLNRKLEQRIPMDRFRPNVVVRGTKAHEEDDWLEIRIRDAVFTATKSCARCQIINVDQNSGVRELEPLKTLATYRSRENKVYLGRYFKLSAGTGTRIHQGDRIEVSRMAAFV